MGLFDLPKGARSIDVKWIKYVFDPLSFSEFWN